jgi:hypothetical protein
VVILVGIFWNIWHTIQQRYGILRAYAARAKSGPESARRDFWVLWTLLFAVVALVPVLQRQSLTLHPLTARVGRFLAPWTSTLAFSSFSALAAGVAIVGLFLWARAELRTRRSASPRLVFLTSTVALLSIFVLHGPIIGYLCFGTAHALEYLAFVHHFGQSKYRGQQDSGIVGRLLRRPALSAPLLMGSLVVLYVTLREFRSTDVYITYYLATSWLHFLYDGWIWKLRRPEVAAPISA